MNPSGSLTVSARYAEGRLHDLAVRLARPPVARMFMGRSPQWVAETIPRLYSLCSQAQRAAAQVALGAAAGEALPAADDAALWYEALHEHLWRLLLDWPAALGLPAARAAFVAWHAARSRPDFAAATARLLAATLHGEWAWECCRCLPDEAKDQEFDLTRFAPGEWLAYWQAEQGAAPITTGPASIAGAWLARRDEALEAAEALADGRPYPRAAASSAGWGVGQTLTARGVLTHAVRLEAGRVADYRVWAPTDGHFANAQGLATLLAGARWTDGAAARRSLAQAVLALDPCLAYTREVEDA